MKTEAAEKNKGISGEIRSILEKIGEDPERDVLEETWKRRVPDMFEELTQGYRESEKPEMTSFSSEKEDMVVKQDIPFYSLCEHHMLPFFGKVHLAYIPDGEIMGLSKLIRYVRWRSRKLLTQERLAKELAEGLNSEIDAQGAIVKIEAEHLCESMRGIETQGTLTTTLARTGVFEQEKYEQKFYDLLGESDEGN